MTRDHARHPPIYRLPEAAPEVWQELEDAFRLLANLDEALRSHWKLDVSAFGGSQLTPVLSPFRCLILACVGRQAVWGIRPVRLARMLRVPGSLLNYHLSRLEKAGLIYRSADTRSDGRRVMVHLTWAGGEALAASTRVLRATTGARDQDPSEPPVPAEPPIPGEPPVPAEPPVPGDPADSS